MRSRFLFLLLFGLSCAVATPAWAQPKGDAAPRRPVIKPPKPITLVEAKYPKAALDARVEGDVVLKITIGATGKVMAAEVLKAPAPSLGEAAKAAAMQFVFQPATVDGTPTAVSLPFTVSFALPVLPAKFTGKVVDKTGNTGLKGASVTIEYKGDDLDPKPKATDTTKEDGSFSFQGVPAGMYSVRLKIDAYRDFSTQIELVAGKTSEATYKIEAQPINLTGVIREAGTRKVLPGMKVEVNDPKGNLVRQGFSNDVGRFSFRGLPPGTYNVRVDAQAYVAVVFKEKIAADQRNEVQYYVQAEFYDEYTVSTSAKRERREVSRQRLTLEETRRIPGTGGDVVRVVQNLPGVARAPFNSGQLIVRGSNPQDSAVFLMGDELPLVFHFAAGPAVVNSEMIEAIDFYPGNFSSRYGRAIGGIIDLNTRSPRLDGFHGFAEVDLQDATAVIEVPITEDLTFALAGRRSYIDLVLNAVLPSFLPPNAPNILVAPFYYDYQSWLTYTGLDDHKLELFLYGSSDQLSILFSEALGNETVQITSANQLVQFNRGQFRWEWKPRLPIENKMTIGFGTNDTELRVGNITFQTNSLTTNVRDDLKIKMAKWLDLRLGVDMQFQAGELVLDLPAFGGDGPLADGLQSSTDFSVLYPALYAEFDIKPIEGLSLQPGVRLDHYGTVSQTTASPRLAGRWQINKNWAAKGGVGLFNQAPGFQQTDPLTGGNPRLRPEEAIHYALGGEWRPLDYLEFNTTLFYRDVFSLVNELNNPRVEDPDFGPQTFVNDGKGRSYGAEVLLRHYPNNKFFGWIAYTLSRSERLNLDTNEYDLFQFDQTHILTAVAGYNFPFNIDLSLKFQFVTGNPITPLVGAALDIDDDSYSDIPGATNSARNAPFNQLDLRLDKRFIFDTWMLGLYLDIQNVYNAANAEGVTYNFDNTESQPISGIPFFPSLGVNAKF